MERTNKASIHEQKIRCAYLSAEDGTGNPNGIPEENEDSMSPIDHSRMDESVSLACSINVRGRVMRSRQQRGLVVSRSRPIARQSPLATYCRVYSPSDLSRVFHCMFGSSIWRTAKDTRSTRQSKSARLTRLSL